MKAIALLLLVIALGLAACSESATAPSVISPDSSIVAPGVCQDCRTPQPTPRRLP